MIQNIRNWQIISLLIGPLLNTKFINFLKISSIITLCQDKDWDLWLINWQQYVDKLNI